MTTKHAGTPTPPEVAKHATEKARIIGMALLGIFGSTSAPSALLRLPRGRTQSVKVGDDAAGSRVDAIGEDRVVLNRNGRQQLLHLPQG